MNCVWNKFKNGPIEWDYLKIEPIKADQMRFVPIEVDFDVLFLFF